MVPFVKLKVRAKRIDPRYLKLGNMFGSVEVDVDNIDVVNAYRSKICIVCLNLGYEVFELR